MVNFNLLSELHVLGESREKKTLEKIKQHTALAYETVKELYDAVEAFEGCNNDCFREKQKRVDLLEKKADRLRREIEEDLYSGAFLPISRSRILDFAENIDKVSDTAEDASKMLFFLRRDEVSNELLTLLKEGIGKALDSVNLLKESIDQLENLDVMRSIIKRIRAKEHESDEVTYKAYELIYGEDEKSPKVLHLLTKLVEFVSDISDKAEDASDSLSLIVLMHKV